MDRRQCLRLLLLAGAGPVLAAPPRFPAVHPRTLVFPRDHGAHPDFRTEWWYATGWLETPRGAAGFQVTVFRSRTGHDPDNPSRFAPHQLLFGHAALAWPAQGRLQHEQLAARVLPGDGTVRFAEADMDLVLRGWRFHRDPGSGQFFARVGGGELRLDLALAPTQELLLQGDRGYSRKGPGPEQASYYYSLPQLAVTGSVGVEGSTLPVSGRAWLDHEWSTSVLDGQAAGWDWLGLNLADGGALMAFRIRARDGGAPRWAAARLRRADGREISFGAAEVDFATLGSWRSPRTGTTYPVRCRLTLGRGAAALVLDLEPLLEDQELDSRQSTGAVYWEGAVTARREGRVLGRGYLELVGYHSPMRL